MKILLVTDWNRGQGGAENYLALLRDTLRARGEDVRLLTSTAGTAGDGTAEYQAFGTSLLAAQTVLQVHNPFAATTLRRALADFQPDAALINMFAHHLSPAIVRGLAHLPTVLLVSDYKCICPLGTKLLPDNGHCRTPPGLVCWRTGCLSAPHWLREQPRYALIRRAIKSVTRIVACSDWVRQELARHDLHAETILLPVRSPGPGFRRRPSATPQFLFCGRFDREKGAGLLLRAFARLRHQFPAATLRLVGRGPLRPALEAEASRLGLAEAAHFCGWLEPDAVARELETAWASVVPSLWPEPFGLVAAEAIVHGVPVIASAAGGLPEIIEEGVNGLLVPPNEEHALWEKLRTVAAGGLFPNGSLPPESIERAKARFSAENHADAMRRHLAAAVQEKAAGRPVPSS